MAPTIGSGPPVALPRSRQAWNFIRHYIEMCIAMCIGVALANITAAAATSATDLDVREQFPVLMVAALAVFITLPMVAWMRFRAMAWRPILEMCVAGMVVVLAAVALGLVSPTLVSAGAVCGLECVGMLVAMLLRYDLYAGKTGHHHMANPA